EQQERGSGRMRAWWRRGPVAAWRYGPRGLMGPGEDAVETGGRSRLPWVSTLLITAFVMLGSTFAAHAQEGERVALDPFARLLLFAAAASLLLRHRHPVAVLGGTVGAVLLYLGAGYPYGPVFLVVAVACFTAVVAGHRRAAWTAMGTLWA